MLSRFARRATVPAGSSGRSSKRGVSPVDRRELFVPGAVQWPGGGVRLLAEHRGRAVMTFTAEDRRREDPDR